MAELPSGAVTFLFTDIEGSTGLVKQLRERWGEVLAEHQRLLRAAFAQHRLPTEFPPLRNETQERAPIRQRRGEKGSLGLR